MQSWPRDAPVDDGGAGGVAGARAQSAAHRDFEQRASRAAFSRGQPSEPDGIVVESAPGQGTTFTVYLPRIESAIETAPATDGAAPLDQASGTILFVEDEQSIQTMGARALRERGYTVLTARHSEGALAVADEWTGSVDLLVTDIVMPGLINGRALAKLMRRSRPSLKVLFTSGYLDDSRGLRDLQAEDAGFLPKPYSLESLAFEVAQALSRGPDINLQSPSPESQRIGVNCDRGFDPAAALPLPDVFVVAF